MYKIVYLSMKQPTDGRSTSLYIWHFSLSTVHQLTSLRVVPLIKGRTVEQIRTRSRFYIKFCFFNYEHFLLHSGWHSHGTAGTRTDGSRQTYVMRRCPRRSNAAVMHTALYFLVVLCSSARLVRVRVVQILGFVAHTRLEMDYDNTHCARGGPVYFIADADPEIIIVATRALSR